MKCDIKTLKGIRDTLQEASSEAKALGGDIASTGESFELTAKLFDDFAKSIRDPQQTFNMFNERVENLSKPFHREVRKELGEELFVEVDGKEKKHYILASNLVPALDAEAGVAVVLRMAPHDNLHEVSTYVFNLESDTSIETTGSTVGTIEGITPILKKVAVKAARHEAMMGQPKEPIEHNGDSELKNTLTKMTQADEILGSREKRTGESLRGYEKIVDFKHGDVESMRSLMAKLHVLGKSKASESLIGYYNGLLDRMHPRFFNHLDMYLRKNSVETEGFVNYTQNTMVLDINTKTKKEFSQSEAEVYMHEVIHTMTAWALRQAAVSVSGIKTALNEAMRVAKQNITWQDFLTVDEAMASEREKERAKAQRAYIFASTNNSEEFMAYALTNPRLMELTQKIKMSDGKNVKEPKTVFEKVLSVFTGLMNKVLGTFKLRDNDITVFDQVNKLAFALAEVNNKSKHDLEKMNPIGQMMEVVEDSESFLSKKLHALVGKLESTGPLKVPAEDAGLYERAKFFTSAILKGLTNPTYRGFIGLWASALRIAPDGTIREFLSGVYEKSTAFRIAESLNLRMGDVDASRNSVINAASRQIIEAFKIEPTIEEDSAITKVLIHTGFSGLRYARPGGKKISNKEMIQLLTDEQARYTREGRVKHKILKTLEKDPKRGSWVVAQAYSLGYFMATGRGHTAMNMNADNIVQGDGTNERFQKDPALANMIRELAALTAIKHTDQKDKDLVARLIKDEGKAINVISDMYEGYKRLSREHLFQKGTKHMVEGHTRELFDDSIDVKIAPVSERSDMESKGFKFKYQLPTQDGVAQKVPMAMYTTDSWGKTERLRGAVALGKLHAKGTALSNIKRMEDPALAGALFQRDFANVYNNAIEIHNAMREGTFDPEKVSSGLVPIYDNKGVVVDFRYMMSKQNKERILKQDFRASQVLSRSLAGIQYQINTEALNRKSLLAIRQDMEENWKESEIGEDGYTEYALIGPNSTDPKMLELYAMLPDSFREFILSRSDKTMAVRKSLLRIYFGGAHMKTSNIPGIHLLPGVIKSAVDTAEGVWMEFIKISKGAILLKMPMILVLNIGTNILFQITQGAVDIPQLAIDYKDSTKEVGEYIKYKREIARLEQEINRDREALRRVRNSKALENKIGEKMTEVQMLRRNLHQNPAHELFEAGMYQSHVEDLNNSALGETNRIAKVINSRMEKLPALVRGAAEISYLTQNTAWYKASQEVLQRSDMISRLVENKQKIRIEERMANGTRRLPKWWTDKKGKDYEDTQKLVGEERKEFLEQAKEVRMYALLDNYINYTLPNSNFEEYLNRLGVLMFTKYFKRIQYVIGTTTMSNPIKSTLLVMAVMAGLKLEMIQDQAIIGKMFDSDGTFSLTNVVQIYSPLYHIENVFTPALIKDEHLGGLF